MAKIYPKSHQHEYEPKFADRFRPISHNFSEINAMINFQRFWEEIWLKKQCFQFIFRGETIPQSRGFSSKGRKFAIFFESAQIFKFLLHFRIASEVLAMITKTIRQTFRNSCHPGWSLSAWPSWRWLFMQCGPNWRIKFVFCSEIKNYIWILEWRFWRKFSKCFEPSVKSEDSGGLPVIFLNPWRSPNMITDVKGRCNCKWNYDENV